MSISIQVLQKMLKFTHPMERKNNAINFVNIFLFTSHESQILLQKEEMLQRFWCVDDASEDSVACTASSTKTIEVVVHSMLLTKSFEIQRRPNSEKCPGNIPDEMLSKPNIVLTDVIQFKLVLFI